MAHAIGQMFYFGDKPWHGLGQKLAGPANLEQALKAGGLDWKPRHHRAALDFSARPAPSEVPP